jgi:hypothetical protein
MRFRFTIRDLLWLTLLAAILTGYFKILMHFKDDLGASFDTHWIGTFLLGITVRLWLRDHYRGQRKVIFIPRSFYQNLH